MREKIFLPKKMNEMDVPNDILREGESDDAAWPEIEKLRDANNIAFMRGNYQKMGIEIIGEKDDLFYEVALPEGWRVEDDTGSCYWTYLLDANGRKRASMFYKGVFYDRDAFIRLQHRFRLNVDHIGDYNKLDYDKYKLTDINGKVLDGDIVVHTTRLLPGSPDPWENDKNMEILRTELKQWMAKNYPDWENWHAYWEKETTNELC